MAMQTVCSRIVDLFKAEGVRAIFAIGDVNYMGLQDAADRNGIRLIWPHHEQAGGFMADAMTRMTGIPHVVAGAPGPGVANMVPAAICASKENVPVIFFCPQRPRKYAQAVRRSQHQYTDQPRYFEPAVKYAGIIEFPDQTDEVILEAFRQAQTGKPGPVFVELSSDKEFIEVDFPPLTPPDKYRVTQLPAWEGSVDKAAGMLAGAQSPIILAGTGVHTARAHDALAQLVAAVQCPVITTWGGRGVLPETDEHLLIYSWPATNTAIAEADVVLAVGTSIGEAMNYGRLHHYARGNVDRSWIYIERDPSAIGVNRSIDLPVIGDLRDVLPQLTQALRQREIRPHPGLKKWREQLVTARTELINSAPDTKPVHPGRLMVEARKAIPDDAVIIRDGGNTTLWDLAYFEQRSRDYMWTSKLGHLGSGLPYAIGAKLAVGDRPVALLSGDSSFMFHATEIETAVRHDLPVVVIVNYDQKWGMEVPGMSETLKREIAIEQSFVRMDKMAEAMGGHGEFVEETGDIAPAVERAFASGKPAVVQVVVDERVNNTQMPNWDEFIRWYGDDGAYR